VVGSSKYHPGIKGAVGDPHARGGLTEGRDPSNHLTAINTRYWFRSVWKLGIFWVAMCHMVVAFPLHECPMQALFNHIPDDLILEGDLAMVNGVIVLSESPGLGVTLDTESIAKFAILT